MISPLTPGPWCVAATEDRMRRDAGWHQKSGRWARSLGHRGVRVRLFQKRKDGVFYRDVWCPGGVDRKSLGTTESHEAEKLGLALLGELVTKGKELRDGALFLGELWRRFSAECPQWLDNEAHTRDDDEGRIAVIIAHFGDMYDVRNLSAAEVQLYAAARRRGGIKVDTERVTKAVRARSVAADLRLLKQMLRWATTVRMKAGRERLLDRDPLVGVTIDREKDPNRPLATWDRFEKTREAIHALRDGAETDEARLKWTRLELALVLAEATGRRRGSICGLAWEDVDLTRAVITWRAETEKTRRTAEVGIPLKLLEELKRFRQVFAEYGGLQTLRGWLFPSQSDSTRPIHPDLLSRWLLKAEGEAKLPKLRGGLWHPFRRGWATARKHHPVKDVAAAGGWKDINTLLTSYTAADSETVLAVMSEERKIREVAVRLG
jgi:integrase